MTNLIMFDGVMGSGKTVGMSLKALDWQKRSGCALYSNYGLIGSEPFTKFEDFLKVAAQPSSIICLDESHMDISNRDFNMNSVKFFVQMVFFLRKMRCTLMMTSPLFENIDSKVRDVTNIYIHVSNHNGFMNYDFYDVQLSKYLRTEKVSNDFVKQVAGSIYDTYEMVVPLEYPDKRDQYLQVFDEMKRINKNYIQHARNNFSVVS